MDISVIIVNYNTQTLTLQCLESVFKHTNGVQFEVILVDNGSSDDTVIFVKQKFPKTLIIETNENLGFGRANNLGAKKAKGKYLFFLNSDTILLNNSIKYFFDFFENYPLNKVGAAGSLLLDKDLKPTHSSGSFPLKTNTLKVTFLGYFDKTYFFRNHRKEKLAFGKETFFNVDYITGADLYIPHEIFDQVGGFDSTFFMYYEDTDLQKRLKKLELKRIIIDGPKIIHLEGGSNSFSIVSAQKRILVTKSLFQYFKKHSIIHYYLLFRLAYFFLRLPVLFDKRILFGDRIKYLAFLIR